MNKEKDFDLSGVALTEEELSKVSGGVKWEQVSDKMCMKCKAQTGEIWKTSYRDTDFVLCQQCKEEYGQLFNNL